MHVPSRKMLIPPSLVANRPIASVKHLRECREAQRQPRPTSLHIADTPSRTSGRVHRVVRLFPLRVPTPVSFEAHRSARVPNCPSRTSAMFAQAHSQFRGSERRPPSVLASTTRTSGHLRRNPLVDSSIGQRHSPTTQSVHCTVDGPSGPEPSRATQANADDRASDSRSRSPRIRSQVSRPIHVQTAPSAAQAYRAARSP